MVARRTVWVAILAAGCAVRSIGFVEAAGDDTVLVQGDGARERLALTPSSSAVEHLDGHFVEVLGTRRFGRIRVDAWRAIEGPHGMPVWTGPVQRAGSRVGIQDLATQTLVLVDADVAAELAPFAGDLIAAEGYLDGDRLVVVSWRPLVDAPSSGAFRP